jgi:glycosyltransferase involved in cell wall biosynthesis
LSPDKGAKVYLVQHHETFDYLPKAKVAASYLLPLHKIAVAQWLVDLMQTQYNDPNVSLVPNSVDLNQFNAPPRSKQATPTVGVVYSTAPWKGCELSFKAFILAAERLPHLRLLAFGEQAPIPSLPLPARTEYVLSPSQAELKILYARCDAWLIGSYSEGFGLPALEAMACRTPVIGTPTGAIPELVTDGAGILVKPGDAEAMAEAIEQIYSLSETEWQEMSDAAYRGAKSYTWDDATTLFEAALQTAIDRQKLSGFIAYPYNLKLIKQQ